VKYFLSFGTLFAVCSLLCAEQYKLSCPSGVCIAQALPTATQPGGVIVVRPATPVTVAARRVMTDA
jgi:hypothetical protein